MSRVKEEKFPESAYFQGIAGFVLHAANAGLRLFDQAQREGRTKRINAELAALMPASADARGAFLNEWLKTDLVKPVTDLVRIAAVEGLDRAEALVRAEILGEATASRLFVDHHEG